MFVWAKISIMKTSALIRMTAMYFIQEETNILTFAMKVKS